MKATSWIGRLARGIEQLFATNYWRERAIARQVIPAFWEGAEILDLGAGSCKLTTLLQRSFDCRPIDIVDHNMTSIEMDLYDGIRLPYEDDSFDIVLIAFVLHHADDDAALLGEAIRVARSKLVVCEDVPTNAAEIVACRFWDYVLNHFAHDDVRISHSSSSFEEWESRLLAVYGVRSVRGRRFRTLFPVLGMFEQAIYECWLVAKAD